MTKSVIRRAVKAYFKRDELGGYIPFNHYLWPSQTVPIVGIIGLFSFLIWGLTR